MVGSYNSWLVLLSVSVAVLSSYVALDSASRITAAKGFAATAAWFTVGTVAMGLGIWAMHYVGMLAYRLPVETSFGIGLTLLSALLSVLGSGFAFSLVLYRTWSIRRLLAGGGLMGVVIVSMHYTGIAALQVAPHPRHQPLLVALSVLIAVSASVVALWSAFRLRLETPVSAIFKKMGSALVMGAGMYGMHDMAMAAAVFEPGTVATAHGIVMDSAMLAVIVGAAALLLQLLVLLLASYDAYRATSAETRAEALREARAHLEAHVRERTAELAQLSRRLVDLEESERKRISHELHDRIGQNLTALNINLDIMGTELRPVERPVLQARLDDSRQLVEATMDSVEQLMAELRPPMLDEHGLLAALRTIGSQFSRRTGIRVDVKGPDDVPRLAPEIELGLCRIAQEALTNVSKHAGASRVEIVASPTDDGLTIGIHDNGVGFAPEATVPHRTATWGMAIMRERAQAIGATLNVESEPGSGTCVTVHVRR